MASGVMIDLTTLDSDDEDTPDRNVALVQRSASGWAGASHASKRRRTSLQVQRHQASRTKIRAAMCQLRFAALCVWYNRFGRSGCCEPHG